MHLFTALTVSLAVYPFKSYCSQENIIALDSPDQSHDPDNGIHDANPGLASYQRMNAPQIFNSIHSSLRQWGSSLNHNGMSIFVAHIPQGTELYHGRGDNKTVVGLEWLGFEPEHALNFAWDVGRAPAHPRPGAEDPREDNDNQGPSTKWLLQSDPDLLFAGPLERGNRFQARSQHPLVDDNPSHQLHRPRLILKPGYLHTFTAAHPLTLLYLDGQSAAKSGKGTLDSQDEILRIHDPNGQRNRIEYFRSQYLCRDLAGERWGNRIHGFIRMVCFSSNSK